jgi:CheY-like chemotaxis protein
MGHGTGPGDRRLVLLVDNEVASRRQVRAMLEAGGLEVVQAASGLAALELIQRLPNSFRLVITDVDLPGISGLVLMETLRLFRPDLPVICMLGTRAAVGAGQIRGCLNKPIQSAELDAVLAGAGEGWSPGGPESFPESAAARARERFAVAGDLVEAALELARGGEEA